MVKSSSIMFGKSCVVDGQFANADLSTGFDLFVNFKIGLPPTAQADGPCTNVKEVQKSASNNIYFYINHSLFDPLETFYENEVKLFYTTSELSNVCSVAWQRQSVATMSTGPSSA